MGVVTKPFSFEGRRRESQAEAAIEALRSSVDTLIIVSNDRLLQYVPETMPLQSAFSIADDVLRQGIIGISEILLKPGLVSSRKGEEVGKQSRASALSRSRCYG